MSIGDREFPGGMAGPVGTQAIGSRHDPWFLALITGREDFGDIGGSVDEENVNLYQWERISKIIRSNDQFPIVKLEASNDEKGPWLDAKFGREVGFALNIHEISTDGTGARDSVELNNPGDPGASVEFTPDTDIKAGDSDGSSGLHFHSLISKIDVYVETYAGSAMWERETTTDFTEFLVWLRESPVPVEIRTNLGAEPTWLFHYNNQSIARIQENPTP